MKRIIWRGLAVLTATILVCILALPGFAYDPNSSGTVSIPEGVSSLSSGSIPKTASNIVNVRTVYVPSSVKSIGAGTFTGFINLRNVVIRNDRDSVRVSPGAASGSTRMIYSGAPVAHTTAPVTHATVPEATHASQGEPRATRRAYAGHGSSTKAAGRWVEELQGQQTETVPNRQNYGQSAPQTITYTNENGEVMVTIPGDANKPERGPETGTPGLRIASWVLVGLAVVSAAVLVWAKVRKK